MFCPLKFVIKTDTMARKPEMQCDQGECAWWVIDEGSDLDSGECAIKCLGLDIWSIKTLLSDIANAVGIIADRQNPA
jgi:hypothetical protein